MAGSQGLPHGARLHTDGQVKRVASRGDSFVGVQCVVRRLVNDGGGARLATAAPHAYGDAVRRNRFRRLVREAFRRLRAELGDHDFLVSPRRGLERPSLEGLSADLRGVAAGRLPARPAVRGRRP